MSDSMKKWDIYREKQIAWNAAVENATREKQAKALMSKGDFAGADKVLKSKGAKKTAKKR